MAGSLKVGFHLFRPNNLNIEQQSNLSFYSLLVSLLKLCILVAFLTVLRLEIRFVEQTAPGRYSACASATVRCTLRDGTMHEDCGGGSADNMRSKADAIMKAEKEAVTDARKRTLKNFGLRLGLSLYDREHLRRMRTGTENSAPIKDEDTAGPTESRPPLPERNTLSSPSTRAARNLWSPNTNNPPRLQGGFSESMQDTSGRETRNQHHIKRTPGGPAPPLKSGTFPARRMPSSIEQPSTTSIGPNPAFSTEIGHHTPWEARKRHMHPASMPGNASSVTSSIYKMKAATVQNFQTINRVPPSTTASAPLDQREIDELTSIAFQDVK